MALTLYVGSKRYSSWSLRPYVALSHTGLPFTCTTIALDQPTTSEAIARISPSGRVPALHHDEVVVWDSLAICEYLHELAPAAQLWPADRVQRARARAISAEMHAGFAAMRRELWMDLGTDRSVPGLTRDAILDARRVVALWREALAASGGPFLFGAFSIADAMYAPVTARFLDYAVELDAVCEAYVAAVDALPAMQAWRRDAAAEPPSRP
jgi:glutathione S-transferase